MRTLGPNVEYNGRYLTPGLNTLEDIRPGFTEINTVSDGQYQHDIWWMISPNQTLLNNYNDIDQLNPAQENLLKHSS